jgi:protein-disulfide isomerase
MRLFGTILAAAAIAAGSAASVRAKDLDHDKLYSHIRESYNIPAEVDLSLGELKASPVPGFDVGELTFSREGMKQSETLYVSKDRRFYLMGTDAFKDVSTNPDKERIQKLSFEGRPIRGNSKATVTLIEFTDFQCPYCSMGFHILRDKMMKDFPTQVKWVYKSFPLKSIHPWAEGAAIAAECVREQGVAPFWKMHDELFEEQRSINAKNADEKFAAIAKSSGADPAKFQTCYDSRATAGLVSKDEAEGDAIGLRSTPSFLINGHLIAGADYDSIKRIIEESLKGLHGGS